MRVILAILLTCLALPSPAAERLSNGYTQHPDAFFRAGFWWDPENPGWGIDLHLSGERLVAAWATHDAEGQPVWYLGVGDPDGETWRLAMQSFRWVDGGLSAPEDVGEVSLRFVDGHHAEMDWRLGNSSGRTAIESYVIDDRPLLEDRTGFWYETRQPGYGLSVVTQGQLVMTVFFFYDVEGQPRWVWADNVATGDPERLTAYRVQGECPGCPPVEPQVATVGELAVRFQSENDGRLDARIGAAGESLDWQVSDREIHLLSNRASGRRQPFSLMPFTNTEALARYLASATEVPGVVESVDFSPAPSTDVSTTNLQEQGVDEADVIKTDGVHLYALDPGGFDGRPHQLRVLRLAESIDGEPIELARVELGEGSQHVEGFYLVTGRDEGLPDLLIVSFGGTEYASGIVWFSPWPWVETASRLLMLDVSDPAQPTVLSDIELDGGSIETRRIGETLYLVSRFYPGQEPFEAESLAHQLPQVHIDGATYPLVDPEQALLPPQPPGYQTGSLITLSAFDLRQPGQPPSSVTYVGHAESLYVSENNVFIGSSRYAASIDPGFSELSWPHFVYTDVHQFHLAEEGPVYAGSGAAEGFIAWGGSGGSAFSYSEHDGHLRLVTSSSVMWREGEHRITVLSLADDESADLVPVGHAPSAEAPRPLGKPGERLYGLRFLGDRLYAVSFKKVDPLYVVDLADPSRPRILGELEVTGFSDYLHVLPNDLLLGFGKAAVPAEGPGDGDFAWYQGLQVSLFDVADPAAPRLLRRFELGRRGSESSLLVDHHAFAYLPEDPGSGRAARIAIPVVLHDLEPGASPEDDPSARYPWRLTGLAMFDVTGVSGGLPDLVLRDIGVAYDATERPEHNSYLDATASAARPLIDRDRGWLYLRGLLYEAPWGRGGALSGPH